MKLYEAIVTQKKKPSDNNDVVKTRPVLVVAETVPAAKAKIKKYWGSNYTIGTPNMIFDFNPK